MPREKTDYISNHSIQEVDPPVEEPEFRSELRVWRIL